MCVIYMRMAIHHWMLGVQLFFPLWLKLTNKDVWTRIIELNVNFPVCATGIILEWWTKLKAVHLNTKDTPLSKAIIVVTRATNSHSQ